MLTETARRPTHTDLLYAGNFEPDASRKEKSGCVVRSFQSVFGVQTTEQEWNMRLRDVESIDNLPLTMPLRTLRAIESAYIRHFVERVSTHDTPLGNSLRKSDFDELTLSGKEVLARLKIGHEVCIIGGIIEDEGLPSFHMAHLGLKKGVIISKSDGNIPFILEDFHRYPSFIFFPKRK